MARQVPNLAIAMTEPKKKPGHPFTTPEMRAKRKKKLNMVIDWLEQQKTVAVQQYKNWWVVAASTTAKSKPELYILCAQDFWHWFDRTTKLMASEGITFNEAMPRNYPQTRPVKSESLLQRKLDELKGYADNEHSRREGEGGEEGDE